MYTHTHIHTHIHIYIYIDIHIYIYIYHTSISADFDKVEAGGYATSAVAGVEGAAAVPRF